jgi:hypothetical protein
VLITAFGLTHLLGVMPMASAKNNLLEPKQELLHAAPQEAALVVFEDKSKLTLKKYENAHSLTDSQLVELLKVVGFQGKALKTAWAVAKAESNGRPFAFNGNTKTGDSSFGLFQINMLGGLGPDRRDKYDLNFNAALFNPVTNAQITYRMTKRGTDWSSWTSYTKGAHYKWLNKFPE